MANKNTENEIISLSFPLKCSDNLLAHFATNHSGRNNMES